MKGVHTFRPPGVSHDVFGTWVFPRICIAIYLFRHFFPFGIACEVSNEFSGFSAAKHRRIDDLVISMYTSCGQGHVITAASGFCLVSIGRFRVMRRPAVLVWQLEVYLATVAQR